MGIKRYELSEGQRVLIAPLLPGKVGDPGRTALDNRLFVNGVLWVLRSGARWSDLPERYGRYKTVYKRFTRWARAGVWERVFDLLARERDNEYLMIEKSGAKPIIPQRSCTPQQRAFDPAIYKMRNRIERTIGTLKQLRRIATRYDRIPQNYLASLYVASFALWA